jgi:hypothetical protein
MISGCAIFGHNQRGRFAASRSQAFIAIPSGFGAADLERGDHRWQSSGAAAPAKRAAIHRMAASALSRAMELRALD